MITNVSEAAKEIAEMAEKFSEDKNYMSPFALKAKEFGYRFKGGKQDDITVVVAQYIQGSHNFVRQSHKDLLWRRSFSLETY